MLYTRMFRSCGLRASWLHGRLRRRLSGVLWALLALSALGAGAAWADGAGGNDGDGPAGEPAAGHTVAAVDEPMAVADPVVEDTGAGEVIEIVDRAAPGAAHRVSAKELERFEYNDVHRVLGGVAGVYIREEDGYGLRPNIGMRGSGSERSAKIALMEDGVLIAPAPYSAPAAYYFPLMTRMAGVEVLKGPSAIQYGPNTVGGAINLVSKDIPAKTQISLDVAGGQTAFGKAHVTGAARGEHVGVLVEGIKLGSSGFKELDGGGDTGFDKNEVLLKLRLNSDTARSVYQQLELKLGYSDEVSSETYVGLSDNDFAATPYRRYAATRLDRMGWRHLRAQLSHQVDLARRVELTTTVYHHRFSRAWTKLDGIRGASSLDAVLANPDAGNNAVFYALLTGAADTLSDAEALILTTNDRSFVAQGIQLESRVRGQFLGLAHELDLGARYHFDQIVRHHASDEYWMMGGAPVLRPDAATVITRDETGSAHAVALYVKDQLRRGRLAITAGGRAEIIATKLGTELLPMSDSERVQAVLIPGVGAVYQLSPSLGLLVGVHRGFVPVAPGQPAKVEPEISVNYEAGARWAGGLAHALELIGFFSDYSNLKGTCTLAAGCSSSQVDDEFNAGGVTVWGVEALGQAEVPLGRGMRVPLKLTYTLTQGSFDSSFSSDNPQWGRVEAGDELPYVPEHQLSVQAGLAGASWEVALAGRYSSPMRDVPGSGEPEPGEATDAALVLDLAASYGFGRWGAVYVTLDNMLDDAHVVARRPVGARPGKPRMLVVGYKNTF